MKDRRGYVISEKRAVNVLRRMFPSGEPSVAPSAVVGAFGRGGLPIQANRNWLSKRLTPLKRQGLVRAEYAPSGPVRLARLVLTHKGRELPETPERVAPAGAAPRRAARDAGAGTALERLLALVRRFRKENTSANVVFSMALKEEA